MDLWHMADLWENAFHGSFFSSITNILSYSRGWQIFMCSPLCPIVSVISNTLWGCLKLLWGLEPNRYTTQSDCLVRKRQAIIISPKQRMCENAKSSFCFQNKHSAISCSCYLTIMLMMQHADVFVSWIWQGRRKFQVH